MQVLPIACNRQDLLFRTTISKPESLFHKFKIRKGSDTLTANYNFPKRKLKTTQHRKEFSFWKTFCALLKRILLIFSGLNFYLGNFANK